MIKVWGSVLLAAGALLLAGPSFAQEACSASPALNGDGTVDAADVEVMKAAFGTQSGDSDFDAAADLNNDGLVTTMDYRVMLECS